MRECAGCGRLMRPRNTTAGQYPGTVPYNGVRCSVCVSKATATKHLVPMVVTCQRCGVTETLTGGRKRKYGLCRDCRDVMPRADWEAWAA